MARLQTEENREQANKKTTNVIFSLILFPLIFRGFLGVCRILNFISQAFVLK
jgi:hypothetical protein